MDRINLAGGNECSDAIACEIKEDLLATPDSVFNNVSKYKDPFYLQNMRWLKDFLKREIKLYGKWHILWVCIKEIVKHGSSKEK